MVVPLVQQVVQVVQHFELQLHLAANEAHVLRGQDVVGSYEVVLDSGDELVIDSQNGGVLAVAVQHNLQGIVLPEGLQLEQLLRQLGLLYSFGGYLLNGLAVPVKLNLPQEFRSQQV